VEKNFMIDELQAVETAPETEGNVIRRVSNYDRWVQILTLGKASALRKKTAELAQIKLGDIVLDVGCGTGELTLQAKAIAGSTGQVYGLDPALEMIEVARQKADDTQVHFRVGVIEAIPFPNNHFDVVLSSLMMHHLPDNLKQRGLAEIYRVLKPDGYVMIVDLERPTSFFAKSLMALLLHGGVETGLQALHPMSEAAGFSDITSGDIGFRPLGFIHAQANKSGVS
jgi:ubiquinone/menaquinone biosynthesis C-methylase UbiE